jgi:hypothetical protein
MTREQEILKDKLEKDLYQISRLSGKYQMSDKCKELWVDWYNKYEEDEGGERICEDKSFSGWYSRKPTYILKMAMLGAAATSNELMIEWKHIEIAIEEIRQVEMLMGNAFKAIGKSEITAEVDSVAKIVRDAGAISEKNLMSMIWRDIDSGKFDVVMETNIKAGRIRRDYKDPDGKLGNGTWYYWTGE